MNIANISSQDKEIIEKIVEFAAESEDIIKNKQYQLLIDFSQRALVALEA